MGITLRDFETGALKASDFHHADHVRIGYELIARDSFDVALGRFACGLRSIAAAAHDPGKFHMTITVGFLAAIAERQFQSNAATWQEFADENPELFDRSILRRWYPVAELNTELARKTFVLPGVR
jgi:hypothetical protein